MTSDVFKIILGLQIHPNEKLVSPPSDIIKLGFKEIIGYLSQLDAVADEDTISELRTLSNFISKNFDWPKKTIPRG